MFPPGKSTDTAFSKRITLLSLLLFSTIHIRTLQPGHAIDDAHITYRHVLNFLQGHGWVFNIGDGFLSSSTPLYLILLTILEKFIGTEMLPALSVVLNTILDCALIAFVYMCILNSNRSPFRSFFLVMPLVLYPRLLDYSGCGMESSLFSLLIVTAAWAWSRNKWKLAGILFGLVILTRLDGLIPASVCLGLSFRDRRKALSASGMVALVSAPWFLYAYKAYGGLLPVTIKNKIDSGRENSNFDALMKIFEEVSPFNEVLPLQMTSHNNYISLIAGIAWVFGWFLANYNLSENNSPNRRFSFFIYGTNFLFITAYIIGSPPLYGWYQVPIGVLILIGVFLGQEAVLDKIKPGNFNAPISLAVSASLCGATLMGWSNRLNYFPSQQSRFTLHTDWNPSREYEYRKLGYYLKGMATKDDQVFLTEVGTFGFYSGIHTIDGSGLTSPELGKPLLMGHGAEIPIWERIIMERKPRWAILWDPAFTGTRIQEAYRPMRINRGLNLSLWQHVYERKE